MKLVLQRTAGDCGICALASLLEQSYEDVYIAAAKVDRKTRAKSGICFPALIAIGKELGAVFLLKRRHQDEDAGLVAVTWQKPHGHPYDSHLIALDHGIVADSADGIILPPDEYFTRYQATAGSFLELQ